MNLQNIMPVKETKHKTSYDMILFIRKTIMGKSVATKSSFHGCLGLRGRCRYGGDNEGSGVSFNGYENALKLIVVMDAHIFCGSK